MIGAITDLVTLLLALVLGLMIWPVFDLCSARKTSIQAAALNDLGFDAGLVELGRVASEGGKILRSSIERTIDQAGKDKRDGDFVTRTYRRRFFA
jgi:hypothetical protein